MDELDNALNRVLAIVGSEREGWHRIDRWVAAHRPKQTGKRLRKQRGITDFPIKYLAMYAYEESLPGKKVEAECRVYKRLTGKVPNAALRRQNRKRVRDWLFKDPELDKWIIEHLPVRTVTDK
jgi:hypothetical protein